MANKKKTTLPTSNAKTAYALLSDIARIVTEEPKRLDMVMPLCYGNAKNIYHESAPACGTVACVGGWAIVLKGNPEQLADIRGSLGQAEDILGLSEEQARELFYGFPDAPRSNFAKHAAEEVALIRKFQKKYAAQLKAKAV